METQTLDLMDKGFGSHILNMIKEVKEIMSIEPNTVKIILLKT